MSMRLIDAEELRPEEMELLPEFTGTIVSKGLPADISKLLKPDTLLDAVVRTGVEIEMDERLGDWGQILSGLIEKTQLREFINKRDDDQETELVTRAIARILFTIGYDLGGKLSNSDGSVNNHLIAVISDKLRFGVFIDQKRANCTNTGIQEFRNTCSEFFLEGARAKVSPTFVSSTPATPIGV